ncbi:hypothetical protein B0H19DRAFT_1084105 [Mycena capillaripes]|nr:hypothetical protein B0H19DRAFT_1084105 [Mycena capillaripes]
MSDLPSLSTNALTSSDPEVATLIRTLQAIARNTHVAQASLSLLLGGQCMFSSPQYSRPSSHALQLSSSLRSLPVPPATPAKVAAAWSSHIEAQSYWVVLQGREPGLRAANNQTNGVPNSACLVFKRRSPSTLPATLTTSRRSAPAERVINRYPTAHPPSGRNLLKRVDHCIRSLLGNGDSGACGSGDTQRPRARVKMPGRVSWCLRGGTFGVGAGEDENSRLHAGGSFAGVSGVDDGGGEDGGSGLHACGGGTSGRCAYNMW